MRFTSWPAQAPRRLFSFALCSALLVGFLFAGNQSHSSPRQPTSTDPSNSATPINVALKVDNVYGFSSQDKTYKIEGMLQLSAPKQLMESWKSAGIDPINLVRFQNQVTPWDAQLERIDSPSPSGTNLASRYRFHGIFYSDEINFRGYPFDPLPLHLSLVPDANHSERTAEPETIRLEADAKASGVSSRSNMNGFKLIQWRFFSTKAGVDMELVYRPILWASLVKWLLPLAITMTVMLLTANLRSSFSSERLAIPPVILLTLVFMQQAYRDVLPSLPYLTEIDQLYAFSYLVTLLFFCEFIWCANRMARADDRLSSEALRQMDHLETGLQLFSVSGYAVLLLSALITRGG